MLFWYGVIILICKGCDPLNVAVYSRKSKMTEKGDSVENQIQVCTSHIKSHYPDAAIIVYEDEGFSGGNTDRPMFKKLCADMQTGCIQALVCYRLDRISRNVADFAEVLEMLQLYNVDFISIRENFDTSTPIGRAMVYIASVFAQLERETIAERIRDNLLELSKTGRFLGADAPFGYEKEQNHTPDGKTYNTLVENPRESSFVAMLYQKYLAWQSIKKLETHLMQEGYKTARGCDYSCMGIRRILTHPVYAAADKDMYRYLSSLGCKLEMPRELFSGQFGISVFHRIGKRAKILPPGEWVITVGTHKPVVSGAEWIQVQEIIGKRKALTMRRPVGKTGLLSGILRCGLCGDYMRPFSISSSGRFYYICAKKEASRKLLCECKNTRGERLDQAVIDSVASVVNNIDSAFFAQRNRHTQHKEIISRLADVQTKIKNKQKEIDSLVAKIALLESATVARYLTDKIEVLDQEITALRNSSDALQNQMDDAAEADAAMETFAAGVRNFLDNFDQMDFATRRNALKSIIRQITWDGAALDIRYVID